MKLGILLILMVVISGCALAPKNNAEPTGEVVRDNSCTVNSDCFATGCNREICSTQEAQWSECEWKPVYGCYLRTSCDCIENECQWDTDTEIFQNCLKGVEDLP